jgi:uncharacterized protein
MTKAEHFDNKKSPKRILALDGGGIRGALSLGYLQQMEDILRTQHGNDPKFRLCHYFDLIGGTSTGSIIAACLALGKTVAEIKELYMSLGGEIFKKQYSWWNVFKRIKAEYDSGPLEDQLQKVFGTETTLGSDDILTGLCIVAKRADTNSVWPMINHPDGAYYDTKDGTNSKIPLWKAVRASAAAPSYFLPQIIDVGGGMKEAAFVDGGVSMANNPALQLLMVATLKGFPFQWEWGHDKLLLVSIGTGMSKWKKIPAKVAESNLLNWASQLPDMFMQDASWHNQAILQWLSNSPTAWEIDGEIKTLENDCIGAKEKGDGLISYLRYNTWLDTETLDTLMGKKYSEKDIDGLTEMSNADSRFELYDIGSKHAAATVSEKHFPTTFKI